MSKRVFTLFRRLLGDVKRPSGIERTGLKEGTQGGEQGQDSRYAAAPYPLALAKTGSGKAGYGLNTSLTRPTAASISASAVKRPKLKRMAESASLPLSPIARKT